MPDLKSTRMRKDLVDIFIKKVKSKFKAFNISMGYEIAEDTNEFYIWHNSKELQFNNIEFESYILKLMDEIFEKNNFSNYFVGYERDITLKLDIDKYSFECSACRSKTIVDAKRNLISKELICPICGKHNLFFKYIEIIEQKEVR